jgi:outer membrane protein TolC
MVRNGLATNSDALLADVQRGQVEAQLVAVRGDAALARERLAMLLGQPGDTLFTLPDSLPNAARIRALLTEVTDTTGATRHDVVAAQLGQSAAQSDLHRANAAMLPRLNAFGRYDWNSPDAPFGGDKSYTVGLMASWSPFAGGARLADRQGAAARADAAEAMAEAAQASAALDIKSAESDRRVAAAQLDIAAVAVSQATDAHRIVARKYAGGLATVAELLGAAATETRTRLGLVAARYHLIVAEAAVRHATGADLIGLTALEN